MWAERRSRLEAQRKARETAEKAAAAERAKAQKAAETETSSSSSTSASASATTNVNASRATYLQQQAHRKREAKADRERVLKLLENDKIARREREEARKAAARAALLASGEGQDASVLTQQLESETVPAASPSASRAGAARCALQVRLLDGSTIRSNFPSDTTITAAVRPWISEHINDANSPYTFKQVLTPLPSRALGVSDEVATLRDLGLAPSATLVLVPVQNAVGSILGGKGGGYNSVLSGYVMRAIGRVLGVVEGVYGFFGFGTGAQVQQNANDDNGEASGGGDDSKAEGQSTATAAQGANIRIRTLRDQRADKDESQLYNGNQVSATLV
ncbi:MAG: UBX domain-containing protein [Janthinobacterium lividum]